MISLCLIWNCLVLSLLSLFNHFDFFFLTSLVSTRVFFFFFFLLFNIQVSMVLTSVT